MALASTNSAQYVVVSSATQSDHLLLPDGYDYVLQCSCSGNYTLDIQTSVDGTNWADAYVDASNKATLDKSAKQSVIVPGGLCVRMDVDTYNAAITMTAKSILRRIL